ncbi:MAG: SdrD B-like domain-containing protein, partial [Pirellulaceae bacterium]
GASYSPSLAVDADGYWRVAFASSAPDLIAQDANGQLDVFVRDQRGMTIWASERAGGGGAHGSSQDPRISADGSRVVFQSRAGDLTSDSGIGLTVDLFARDLRPGGTIELVSVGMGGTAGNGMSIYPVVSSDGRYVAFASYASNLAADDVNGVAPDVFLRDLVDSTTVLVSSRPDGMSGNGGSWPPVFVGGEKLSVVFNSFASDLVGPDRNGAKDIWVARFIGAPAIPAPAGSVVLEQRVNSADAGLTDLLITGSGGHDTIRVERGAAPGQLSVIANGIVLGAAFEITGTVVVRGGDGNDDIQIQATGLAGVDVNGEAGTDTTVIFLSDLTATVRVDNSTGKDGLVIMGTADDDYIVKNNDQVTWGTPALESILFFNIDSIIVDGGAGNDTIIDPGLGAAIFGGPGDDMLYVSDTTGSVSLDGGEGSDEYVIQLGGLLAPLTVLDSGAEGSDRLSVNGTPQDDVISVSGTTLEAGVQTITVLADLTDWNLSAGDGNDEIRVEDLYVPISELVVDGGMGADTVTVGQLGPAVPEVAVVPGGPLDEPDHVQAWFYLSGRVFDDHDNDGVFDPGEAGLADLPITLVDADDEVVDRVFTNEQGQYSLTGQVPPGTYRIVADRASGYLDGRETAGTLGGTVDNLKDSDSIGDIQLEPGTAPAVDYLFAQILPSHLHGLVWEDFNDDGEVDFGERAIANVLVELSGLDDRGNMVQRTAQSDSSGTYSFADLRPSGPQGYALREHQPPAHPDGQEIVGEVNGTRVGLLAENDVVTGVVVPRPNSVAERYNFAERAPLGVDIRRGQTAEIGFWENKNGQKLIKSLNGGEAATQLGNWLAATFPNMFGAAAREHNLAGKSNAQVADYYKTLFKRNGKTAAGGGPPKLEAQVLATALSVYVTNRTLAGNAAAAFGFTVSQHGTGVATIRVGLRGIAFGLGLSLHSTATVLDLLLAVDAQSSAGRMYDLNEDGDADDLLDSVARTLAYDVFACINEAGDI